MARESQGKHRMLVSGYLALLHAARISEQIRRAYCNRYKTFLPRTRESFVIAYESPQKTSTSHSAPFILMNIPFSITLISELGCQNPLRLDFAKYHQRQEHKQCSLPTYGDIIRKFVKIMQSNFPQKHGLAAFFSFSFEPLLSSLQTQGSGRAPGTYTSMPSTVTPRFQLYCSTLATSCADS